MSTTDLTEAKPGDNLILITGNKFRGDGPVTVSRVGRQYLYVTKDGRELRERYDRTTGAEVDQRGTKGQLMTQDQYDDLKQRDALFHALTSAGLDIQHGDRPNLATATLRELLDVLQNASTTTEQ